MKAVIELVSPNGVPVSLEIDQDTDRDAIIATLDRADKIGSYFASRGWAFASTQPAMPSAAELHDTPTFCGYACSPTVDEMGRPSWILVDGKQAARREKQGDCWWSVKIGENEYERVLSIPKGEIVPPVKGL